MGALGAGMGRRAWLFWGGAALVLAALVLPGADAAESGRFRYGAISWKRTDTTSQRVTVTVQSAWRLSHGSIVVFGTQDRVSKPGEMFKVGASETEDPLLKFGDGELTARYDVTVLRVDPLQDMVVGVTEFVHDYPGPGPYPVQLTLCCRVAGTQNALRSTLLQTTVDLSGGSLGSPVFSMLPLVSLDATQGGIRRFRVPAADSGGAAVTFALGTAAQYGYRSVPPPSSVIQSIDAATGIMSINVTCYYAGNCTYRDQNVVVQATSGGISSTADFIVRMQPPLPGASHIPTLSLIAPPAPSPLNSMLASGVMELPVVEVFVGFPVKLSVRGSDSDAGQAVFFEFSVLPAGAVTGELQGTNPAVQALTWAPSEGQKGRQFICAAALDLSPASVCTPCPDLGTEECAPTCPPHRRSEPRCFEIDVRENPAPNFALPTITALDAYMNEQIELEVRAEDGNWADSVTVGVQNVHPEGSSVQPIDGFVDRLRFLWRPQTSFGGWSNDVCFRATDLSGKETVLCIRITVVKCMWNVGAGDTLDSIAAMLGSNYVQLWALNVEKDSPDAVLQENEKVRIGHSYQVRATDNVRYLSVQFATTRATLEMLNYNTIPEGAGDKDPLTMIAGTDMCILPHSCVGFVAAQ